MFVGQRFAVYSAFALFRIAHSSEGDLLYNTIWCYVYTRYKLRTAPVGWG